MRNPERQKERDAILRKEFERLSNKRELGFRVHTFEWCIAKAAKKVFLAYSTAKKIIYAPE